MKIFKIVACALVVVLLVGMVYNNYTEVKNGEETISTALIDDESRVWIIDIFGHCETIDELLFDMGLFAKGNFNYFVFNEPLQHFNFDEFLNNNYTGCCYDFSVWAKIIVLTWAGLKEIAVRSYVIDVMIDNRKDITHSYNHFVVGDNQYYADFTCIATTKRGDWQISDYIYKTDFNYKEIAERYNYKIFNIH